MNALKNITTKLCLSFLLLGIFFLFSSKTARAATYYVAGDTGLDTNNGSISTPWQTIQKAANTMTAGDTVNVKGGVTYSTGRNDCGFFGYAAAIVCLSISGTSGNFITYQAWPGTGSPIIIPSGGIFGNVGFGLLYTSPGVNYIKINGFTIKNATMEGINIGGGEIYITNNIIYNINSPSTTTTGIIVTIESLIPIYIYNNSVVNMKGSGIHINAGTATIKNNIIVNCANGITNNTGYPVAASIDYNNIYNSTGTDYALGLLLRGGHDLSLDPQFTNIAGYDFTLKNTSPLIDAGATLNSVPSDITGTARPQGNAYDMGAYESGYSQANPPNATPEVTYTSPTNSMQLLAIYTGQTDADGNVQFGYFNSFSTIAVGDVNGDMYDDVLVGERQRDPKGGLYVFYGSNNPADTNAADANLVYQGIANEHGFGENSSVADLDGDGIKDFIVTNYSASTAYIFKGGSNLTSGSASLANATITGSNQFGFGSTILGDINNDGYQDFAIQNNSYAYFFLGNGSIANKTSDQANFTIASGGKTLFFSRPGDVNGDGIDDIILGCPTCASWGAVYIYYGKADGWLNMTLSQADIVITGSAPEHSVGNWVNLADVNGDGYDDVLIASQEKIFVYYGGLALTNKTTLQADVVITADTNFPYNLQTGKSVVGADINNDGYADIIFSSSVGPRTYVVYGGPQLVSKNASQADLIYDAISAWGGYYGGPMEVGDVNGDGYKDVVVGAGMWNMRQGRAYVLTAPHGSPQINVGSIGLTGGSNLSGTISDTLAIGGVEASFDNGSWTNCTLDSGSFGCSLSGLSGGQHSVRIRSKTNLGVYIPPRDYVTRSFGILTPSSASTCSNTVPTGKTPWLYEASANNGNSITLKFTNWQTPVDHFALEYGTKPGDYRYGSTNIGGNGTKSYLVKSLSPNTKYYFRVRGGNGCATGAWSNEMSATTKSSAGISSSNSGNFSSELKTIPQEEVTQYKSVTPTVTPQPSAAPLSQEEVTSSKPQNIFVLILNFFLFIFNFIFNFFKGIFHIFSNH